MTNRSKEKLNEIYLESQIKTEFTEEDLMSLNSIYFSLTAVDRQENAEIVSKTLIYILAKLNQNKVQEMSENTKIKLKDFIESLSVTDIKDQSQLIFIKFLNNLNKKNNSDRSNAKKLVDQYKKFDDIISDVSWIFSLKIEDNYLFPIHDLVLDLASTFQVDNDHLIHLAIALQLYNQISKFQENDEEDKNIRIEIEQIIEDYNMRCLKYLLDSGQLIQNSDKNYFENGTLIFKQGNSILIRNLASNYFLKHEEIEEERNGNGDTIAYYIEKEIPKNSSLKSFTDIMLDKKIDSKSKSKFIDYVIQSKKFNIFLKDSCVYDHSSKEVIGFTNDFVSSDNRIIYSIKDKEEPAFNDLKSFLEIINNSQNGLREVILNESGLNILTLDFYVKFLLSMKVPEELIPNVYRESKDIIFQSEIIENYFEAILNTDKIYLAQEMFSAFYNFYKTYVTDIDDESTKMRVGLGLIMPYKFDFPLKNYYCILEKIISFIPNTNKLTFENINYTRRPRSEFRVKISEKELFLQPKDLEGNDLDEFDYPEEDFESFVDAENLIVYFDREENERLKQMKKIFEWSHNFGVDIDFINQIDEGAKEKIIELIESVKLDNSNYTTMGSNLSADNRSIVIYKLLWHFFILRWDKEQVESFFDLVLNKHYTESVFRAKELFELWIEKIQPMISSPGVMIFQKENRNNQGTLDFLINDYEVGSGNRSLLTYLNSDIWICSKVNIIDSKEVHYNGEKLKKIVMLTDNIMGGSSTIKALNHYIGDLENDDNKQYLKIRHKIKQILSIQPDIPVDVYAIWGYANGKKKIEECFPNVSVFIENEVSDVFLLTSEIKAKVKKLYGTKNLRYNFSKYLFFRVNNLPFRTIFPTKFSDTKNLIGLFNRKEEVSR